MNRDVRVLVSDDSALVWERLSRELVPDPAVARGTAASIVWGMPGETLVRDWTEKLLPLDRIELSARAIPRGWPS